MATRTSNYQVWNEATFEWDGHLFVPAPHNHSAAEITSGTLGVDRIPTLPQSKITNLTTDFYTKSNIQNDAIPMRNALVSANGVPTNNLGSPSLAEMALFDEQFDNKTAFYPISSLSFETFDGATWTDITSSISDTAKKRLLGGDNNAGIVIPNGVTKYAITIRNIVSYVYLNALYMYWSSNGNSTLVHIWKKRDDGAWTQHTSSSTNVSSWPGHLYLPFSTIPWVSSGGTTHQHLVRVEFTPTWSHATNGITLDKMQWWGGYPASKRTIYGVDENKVVSFPAAINANGQVVVLNNDSRLTDARPASDVSAWAKADTKPSYAWSEIGSRPTKVSDFTNDLNFLTETVAYQDFERAFTKGTAFNKNFGTGSTDVAQGDHTHTASQVGALPSSGGTLSGDLIFDVGDVDRFIKFNYTGGSAGYGWRIGYLGSGSGDANYLSFQTEQTADNNWAEVLRFGLTSKVGTFAVTPKVGTTNVSLEGHIHGNLTSDGKLGGNAYRPVITDLMGKISEGAWATQAEAQAGTSETSFMSPKRVSEAISYMMPSGGVSVSSIKNWVDYVTCTGTTGASLSITANPTVGYIGVVWSFSSSSAHVRNITWVKIGAVDATFKIGASGIPSTSGSTYTELYRFRIYGESTGSMKVDWVYKHTINDTAAEAHPIATATIYVWDVLQML